MWGPGSQTCTCLPGSHHQPHCRLAGPPLGSRPGSLSVEEVAAACGSLTSSPALICPHRGPVLPPANQLRSHWLPGRRASANQRPGRVGQGRAELLLTVAGGKQSGSGEACVPLLDALSSQHGLLSHRLAGVRPACQNHSRSNLSQNLYFSTKDFPLGLPRAASLLYLYHLYGGGGGG